MYISRVETSLRTVSKPSLRRNAVQNGSSSKLLRPNGRPIFAIGFAMPDGSP